jgi:hypothetical protein
MTAIVGFAAALWVIAYLAWTFRRNQSQSLVAAVGDAGSPVHAGEWWIVLAHAVAFSSAYALGASTPSFLLVLAVHHEVQYLYFTYAMSRRSATSFNDRKTGGNAALAVAIATASCQGRSKSRTELEHAGCFLIWPIIGFSGAIAGGWLELEWLAPLGLGGLFCHYWLDARIWRRPSFEA